MSDLLAGWNAVRLREEFCASSDDDLRRKIVFELSRRAMEAEESAVPVRGKGFAYDRGDGTTVYADPTSAWHDIIIACDGRVGHYEQLALSKNPAQKAAGARGLIAATRKALHMIPWNGATGEGVSDAEALNVYAAFRSWCIQKKTSLEWLPIWEPSSDWLESPNSTPTQSGVCG